MSIADQALAKLNEALNSKYDDPTMAMLNAAVRIARLQSLLIAQKPLAAITIKRPDEEQKEFYVGPDYVGEVNHDAHGWAGMDSAEHLIRAIALRLGVEVLRDDAFGETLSVN